VGGAGIVDLGEVAFAEVNGARGGAPVSARQLAKTLRLAYSPVKRVVRGLVAWNILETGPEGLRFQPVAERWRPPPVSESRADAR
jgi:hypothetical protein